MLTNYFVAAILVTPLVSMVAPSINYWRSYLDEKRAGFQGEKADYNFYFYLLAAGVIGMWITWICSIILLYAPRYKNFFHQESVFGAIPSWLIQVVGLVIFFAGAVLYNLAVVAAGKYLRPAPSGTLARHKLIDIGPFALVRHPLYIAYFFINTGLSLAFFNIMPLFFALFIALGIYPTAKAEEAVLEKQLGEKHTGYQKRVGMFFPRLLKRP